MKELNEIFEKLIGFDTTSNLSNLDLIEYVKSLAPKGSKTKLIYNQTKDKANIVIQLGPNKPNGLVLSGHTDTVPVKQSEWNYPTHELTIKDDKYYGRGATDMKAFLAHALYVSRKIDIEKLNAPLFLAFTYDEEVGCIGANSVVDYFNGLGAFKPKYVLVGEPTNFDIYVAHKGHAQMDVELRGIEGHSSKIDHGISAIEHASKAMSSIYKYANKLRENKTHFEFYPDYPFSTLNIGTIKGGKAINIIPGECKFEMGYRIMPGDRPERIYNELEEILQREVGEAIKKKGGELSCKLNDLVPPMLTKEGGRLEEVLRIVTNNHERKAAAYTTEGGLFSNAGYETIICGPGSIEQAHVADEYISKEQLEKGVLILESLINQI